MSLGLSACLTWATEVDVVEAGAHIEAYINTKPIISTIRLCHRYGKGEKAAIARLPAELLVSIEKYIIDDERAKPRKAWSENYRCWEARCDPTDHYEPEELVEMYNDYLGDEICDCCGEPIDAASGEVGTIEREQLDMVLADDDLHIDGHLDRRACWHDRVGSPASQDRGLFSKHGGLLVKDFGLKVWTSHSQRSKAKDGQRPDSGIFSGTVAYFIMPDSAKIDKEFNRRCEDGDMFDVPPWLPTESGYGLSVAIPERPSASSLKRFSSAFKILGLTPLDNASKPELYASSGDVIDEFKGVDGSVRPEDATTEVARDAKGDPSLPELRLLIASKDDVDDLY